MKTLGLYLAFAVLLLLGNSRERRDVADLLPIEAIRVQETNSGILIETDTGDMGIGKNVTEAVEDLKSAAAGTVFMDTADYLLVPAGAEGIISQFRDVLRPSCQICAEIGDVELQDAVSYLRIHRPEVSLLEYTAGTDRLPQLNFKEGRMELVRP